MLYEGFQHYLLMLVFASLLLRASGPFLTTICIGFSQMAKQTNVIKFRIKLNSKKGKPITSQISFILPPSPTTFPPPLSTTSLFSPTLKAEICPCYQSESLVKVVAYKCKACQWLWASAIHPHTICLCHSAKGENVGGGPHFTRTQTERKQARMSRVWLWKTKTRMDASKRLTKYSCSGLCGEVTVEKRGKQKIAFTEPEEAPPHNTHHSFLTLQKAIHFYF